MKSQLVTLAFQNCDYLMALRVNGYEIYFDVFMTRIFFKYLAIPGHVLYAY
jgi:hypothetical protein